MSTSPRFNAASRVDSVGYHPEHQPLDARRLAPILVEGLEHQFDARVERNEFVRAGADRRLLEAVVADLLDIFFRHDPAGSGGAGVERQKIRPRLLQMETDMLRVRRFDRGHLRLHQVVRCAAIALEGEFYILSRHRIAIVEFGVLAQHEFVSEPVFGGGAGFREARRQRFARHRLHHGVVQCVHDHEGGD